MPAALSDHAYDPSPLPIGGGQTISALFIVAAMTEALGLTGRCQGYRGRGVHGGGWPKWQATVAGSRRVRDRGMPR